MPLMEHIRELRNRVLKAVLAVTVGVDRGLVSSSRPSSRSSTHPYCKLPAVRNGLQPGLPASAQAHEPCRLIVTGLFDSFFLHLKLAIVIGIIISAPFWLYQLWAFVAPGLHAGSGAGRICSPAAVFPLFAIGGTIAYFAMTKGLHFLLGQLPANVAPFISVTSYIGYALAMLLIFGLAFELPLVMVLLNLAGVLTHQRFAKWRRMIIFARVRVRRGRHAESRPDQHAAAGRALRAARGGSRGLRLGQRPAPCPARNGLSRPDSRGDQRVRARRTRVVRLRRHRIRPLPPVPAPAFETLRSVRAAGDANSSSKAVGQRSRHLGASECYARRRATPGGP